MKAPYLIVSDLHCHLWNQFATVNADGLNSRLVMILEELLRAAADLKARGGKRMYVAGDILHTRGSMDPEVFNPVIAAFRNITAMGVEVFIIPGNHDLKGRDTTILGNAIQALGEIAGVTVITEITALNHGSGLIMIPWQATKAILREKVAELITSFAPVDRAQMDVIMHVGIDDVLPGVPATGFNAEEIAAWGFKRVFAGDYHNFKEMADGKVFSIGATTHQQWGDIGSKAGYLIVDEDSVAYCASHAPNFIELTDEDDVEDWPILAEGNYVRIRGFKMTDPEINAMRSELQGMGALGVLFQVTRSVVSARAGGVKTKAATLDESVANYIDTLKDADEEMIVAVKAVSADILTTVRSVEA